jgi:nitroimidazol reductase NimA-like FMN-containing flavoprotein (pyridoxamine 5'-phosphate oxidase superfamily)/RimJ/RimL family protein N-acetyltransferase
LYQNNHGRATVRTIPTRYRQRARYDAGTVHAILDEALVCHLGFIVDGAPRVLPTTHARIGDTLYLHGSTGSQPLRRAAEGDGLAVCVTVTLVDALVIARSAFDHSMNYRSVVAHGHARLVTDPQEKRAALHALVDHVATGRADDCRPPSTKELAATSVLALPLDEVSAKVRSGPSGDDPANGDAPYWAGVVPLRTVAGAPQPDPASAAPTPAYLADYHRAAPDRSPWYEPVVLEGQHVRLEPLGPQHVDGLFAAGSDPEVWRWLSSRQPRTRDEMAELVAEALHAASRGERVCWAQIDQRSGEVAGTTSYYEVAPAARHVGIGHTWLGRAWWRSAFNTEAKLLLLERAFDTLGAIRVTWHTDIRNERSQAAIARLGAVREGVLRNHRIRPDGSLRDSVVFSMTAQDWPAAAQLLRARTTAVSPVA